MKVRIGIGAGSTSLTPADLVQVAGDIADYKFDSLWISDQLIRPGLDPLLAMTWAAATRPGLKVGTTMILPGRNPVRLAKQLATLDNLTNGRLLVTFVTGQARSPEREVIGVPVRDRLRVMEEVIPLLRRLHAGEEVSYEGIAGQFEQVRLLPRPRQQPFEFWLGGMSARTLEICGRVGDGWLPSICPPDEALAGRVVIEEAAAGAGRSISAEHFGVSLGYAREGLDGDTRRALAARSRRPDAAELIPIGFDALRRTLEDFLAVGFSKFVLRPMAPMIEWSRELSELAGAVGDMQT